MDQPTQTPGAPVTPTNDQPTTPPAQDQPTTPPTTEPTPPPAPQGDAGTPTT
jgi:hypothetical protein